ncbi:hypothetical protein D3C87_1400090 [compost metagenome]
MSPYLRQYPLNHSPKDLGILLAEPTEFLMSHRSWDQKELFLFRYRQEVLLPNESYGFPCNAWLPRYHHRSNRNFLGRLQAGSAKRNPGPYEPLFRKQPSHHVDGIYRLRRRLHGQTSSKDVPDDCSFRFVRKARGGEPVLNRHVHLEGHGQR